MRYLRMARAWACYQIYMRGPDRLTYSSFGLALLPYAGQWAYSDVPYSDGRDPWGPRLESTEPKR